MKLLLSLYILSLALHESAASSSNNNGSALTSKVKSILKLRLDDAPITQNKKMRRRNPREKYSLTRDLVNNPRFVVGGFAASPSRKRILASTTSTARKAFFGDKVDEKDGGIGSSGGISNRRVSAPLVTDPYSLNKRRNYAKTSSVSMKKINTRPAGPGTSSGNEELVMSSSISADDMMGGAKNRSLMNVARSVQTRVRQKVATMDVGFAGIIATYACTQIAITLPVILIPMIAADPFAPDALAFSTPVNSAVFVGQIVSISSLGAGIGKVVNGFVCKAIGGRVAGSVYMVGLALFSLLLSTTSSIHGYAIAGMEFCASIMWTASSVLMANKYEHDPPRFTAAITALSLASTSGTLIAKTFGGVLLTMFHWRQVCLFATCAALVGSAILFLLVREGPIESNIKNETRKMQLKLGPGSKTGTLVPSKDVKSESFIEGMTSSISAVLANPMYWLLGFAHFCLFIVRSSDKVLGTFIFDATNLPRNLCGPLTTSVTLGFIGGLVSGKKIQQLESAEEKQQFVAKRFVFAVISAIGLAVCANANIIGLAGEYGLMGQYGLAGSITILSGLLAASVGFQFYQFPPKFSTTFGPNKAVYISLTDALGFLLLSPFWSSMSSIVASNGNGWTISWLIVASFLALGGAITVNWLPTILRLEPEGKRR